MSLTMHTTPREFAQFVRDLEGGLSNCAQAIGALQQEVSDLRFEKDQLLGRIEDLEKLNAGGLRFIQKQKPN